MSFINVFLFLRRKRERESEEEEGKTRADVGVEENMFLVDIRPSNWKREKNGGVRLLLRPLTMTSISSLEARQMRNVSGRTADGINELNIDHCLRFFLPMKTKSHGGQKTTTKKKKKKKQQGDGERERKNSSLVIRFPCLFANIVRRAMGVFLLINPSHILVEQRNT